MVVYGISTCDSCKKALKALSEAGYAPQFRDVRAAPLSADEIAEIIRRFPERAVNRAAPSYRALSPELKDADMAAQIEAQPTIMKRPVIAHEGRWSIAWDKAAQALWLPA